jgi:hypothetical protein
MDRRAALKRIATIGAAVSVPSWLLGCGGGGDSYSSSSYSSGGYASGAGLCSNTCAYAHDGECDDGGTGAVYNVCSLGSDCADCGTRYGGYSSGGYSSGGYSSSGYSSSGYSSSGYNSCSYYYSQSCDSYGSLYYYSYRCTYYYSQRYC